MNTPIERMIDAVARCNVCGNKPGRHTERCIVATELRAWSRTFRQLAKEAPDEEKAKELRTTSRRFSRAAQLLFLVEAADGTVSMAAKPDVEEP